MSEIKCHKCGEVKSESDFNWADKKKGKRQGVCRECFSEYNKARYASNPEKFKKDVSRYQSENPERYLETRLNNCMKNPTSRSANRCVEAAVKAGLLKTPDHCSGCGVSGKETRLGAHHYDYTKPLDVVWVCAKCHRYLDRTRREREGKKPYGQMTPVKLMLGDETVCRFETVSDAAKSAGYSAGYVHDMLKSGKPTPSGFKWMRDEAEE